MEEFLSIEERQDRFIELPLVAAGVRAARTLAGLSQAAAAQLWNLSRTTVAKAERGDSDALKNVMSRKLDELGVRLLVDGDCLTVWRKDLEAEESRVSGVVLAAGRAAAGLTQRALATASGVSLRTVVGIEKGRAATNAVKDALAQALHRRRVEIVRQGNEWGVTILSPRETPAPHWTAFPSDDRDLREEAMSRILGEMGDVEIPGLIRCRIEIVGTFPPIWREILIPENATFEDLHRTIQAIFGWREQHSHKFSLGLEVGPASLNSDGSISTGHVVDERLAWLYDIGAETRFFTYLYDFGACWRHRITIGTRENAAGRPLRPIVLDGALAGPIEDSGSTEGYNALAEKMRRGLLSKDEGNWLQRRGYGRDYDPDRFDVAACNAALARIEFDIPKTWQAQHGRRAAVEVKAPFLKARTEPPPKPAVKPRTFKLLSLERFGEEAYDEEGTGVPDEAISMISSQKVERIVTMRSGAARLFAAALERAPDVTGYAGFPVRAKYVVNGKGLSFIPDIEVSFLDGRRLFIHGVWQETVPELPVLQCLARELVRAGHKIAFVSSGGLEDPFVKMSEELRRHARGWIPNDAAVEKVLSRLTSKGNAVPMHDAVKTLVEEGHGHQQGFVGGTPENRALSRLLAAVAQGCVSIDCTKDAPLKSRIGPAGAFDETASFAGFLARWTEFGAEA